MRAEASKISKTYRKWNILGIYHMHSCAEISIKGHQRSKRPQKVIKVNQRSLMVLHFKVISCQLHIYKIKPRTKWHINWSKY